MKPESWPSYMVEKRLRDGAVAYYWNLPSREIARGCPVRREALGSDYNEAIAKARRLNEAFRGWRAGLGGVHVETDHPGFGTVSWLFDRYLKSAAFLEHVDDRTKPEYRRALRRIEDMTTKTGGTLGAFPVGWIDANAADRIYDRLRTETPSGKPRLRQANLSIDVAGYAWKVIGPRFRDVVPLENPWRAVKQKRKTKPKIAATRSEAYALAAALKAIGHPHLGAAALICFEWHQRPENVLVGYMTWADYRPEARPDWVHVFHHKTGEDLWIPLSDGLFREIDAYLAELPRPAAAIVVKPCKGGTASPYSFSWAQGVVRKARTAAGLGRHVTLDACRHGGLTELGDAGVTEQEGMALSAHGDPEVFRGYVKQTDIQRINGARKRRAWVEQNGSDPVVRMVLTTKREEGSK